MKTKKKKAGSNKVRKCKTKKDCICVTKLEEAIKQIDELSKEAKDFFNFTGEDNGRT